MRSQAVPSRVSAFSSAIPPGADRPFFSGSFLLSLAAPPSLVRRLHGRGAFGSSLKGIPPTVALVPGGASAFRVREQSRSSRKKGTIYAKQIHSTASGEQERRCLP